MNAIYVSLGIDPTVNLETRYKFQSVNVNFQADNVTMFTPFGGPVQLTVVKEWLAIDGVTIHNTGIQETLQVKDDDTTAVKKIKNDAIAAFQTALEPLLSTLIGKMK